MSRKLQRDVAALAWPTKLGSLTRAFLLSLCVHAALIGAVWYLFSTSRPSPPLALRVEVELTAAKVDAARPAVDLVPSPTVTANALTKPATPRPSRVARAPAVLAQTISPIVAPTQSNPVPPNSDDAPSARDNAPAAASQDAPAIDLRVLDWLARYRIYPLAARRARLEGVVQLRVTLLPDGRFVDARIDQSSGHVLLDQAALDLLTRAAPLPVDPAGKRDVQIELVLPIAYRMRASAT